MSEGIFQTCMQDSAAKDAQLRELQALGAKGLLCLSETDHAYLLHVTDRPDCARCVVEQTCFAIAVDNACRPDCLREPAPAP